MTRTMFNYITVKQAQYGLPMNYYVGRICRTDMMEEPLAELLATRTGISARNAVSSLTLSNSTKMDMA